MFNTIPPPPEEPLPGPTVPEWLCPACKRESFNPNFSVPNPPGLPCPKCHVPMPEGVTPPPEDQPVPKPPPTSD